MHPSLFVTFYAAAALAAPVHNTRGSDLTILINNDILGPDSPNADSGVILLGHQPGLNAASDCASLGETLWSPEEVSCSIQPDLDYLTYEDKYPADQLYRIASDFQQARAISGTGKIVNINPSEKLPALCTQTAPYSNLTFANTSAQWQVSIESNNEYLTGYRDRLSFRFLGVRYAAQPERFTYSEVYQGNGSHVSALDYGSECVQAPANGSEDCLFMNIFTPYLPAKGIPKSALKPVMFWIHGGAFTGGTGNDPSFDGGSIVSRGDVVLVDINYRLTTLGFLALEDGVTNGNFGFADQITALDWVHAHISDFGGDPDRITIFGQSAGAASVRAHMASPKSIGKFAAAIPQSNLAGSAYATTYSDYLTIPEEASLAADPILNLTNCTNAHSQLDCLRAIPAYTLANLSTVARYLVVDGTYLTSPELPLNKSGPVANIHLLAGFMRDDGAAFITYPNTSTNLSTALTSNALPDTPHVLTSALFPQPTGPNTTLDIFNTTALIATDAEFRCLDQATVYAGVTNSLFKPSTYFYEFNRSYQIVASGYDPNSPVCDAPITPTHPYGDPSLEYFKCHSGDLYFVFGNVLRMGEKLRDEYDLPFEQFVLDSWTSFARTWDPNPDRGFLEARGFTNTSMELEGAGLWEPVKEGSFTLRELQWPSYQAEFGHENQCGVLGYPLDYYLTH